MYARAKLFLFRRLIQLSGYLLFNAEFPVRQKPSWIVRIMVEVIESEIATWNMEETLGAVYCQPHPLASYAWKKLVDVNSNNMGNWSSKEKNKVFGTQKIERLLVYQCIQLLGGNKKSWEGYLTSGGTEGNIFSLWIVRNYLRSLMPINRKKTKVCVVGTSTTHFSVIKAANILDIPYTVFPLQESTWTLSISSLETALVKLKKQGFVQFIFVLTLGYTQTGANDPIDTIDKHLSKIEKKT